MNDQDHIIDAEATEALTVYEPPKPVEFSAELFSTYLVPNSFNDELDFSAYGLEHIAAELGYSITEQNILSETDTHCLMQAKVRVCALENQRRNLSSTEARKKARKSCA